MSYKIEENIPDNYAISINEPVKESYTIAEMILKTSTENLIILRDKINIELKKRENHG